MKRVRFIEPMSQRRSLYNRHIRYMPLMGPVLLATLLARQGYDAVVYNENLTGSVLDDQKVRDDLCGSDLVGISIMTASATRGYHIADVLRAEGGCRIAFGGVHATFCPEEALRHADVVVTGEGESVIREIADGTIPSGIVAGQTVENLEELPLPDFRLVHGFDRLWSEPEAKSLHPYPLVTSRGCPYNCRYCSVSALFGSRFRFRSARKVAEDLRCLREMGYRRFFFYDDNFTADRKRAMEILASAAELGITWTAQVRLDCSWLDPAERQRCDSRLLEEMRRSGGDMLLVGYETIDEETARRWKKGYRGRGTLERRCAEDTRILRETGMWIHGMFILGPDHSEETADGIVRFARRSGIDSIQISALTPFPGTALFEESKRRLLLSSFPDDWDFFDGTHQVFAHARMGVRRFHEKLLQAHREFYRCASLLHPQRIQKALRGPGSAGRKLAALVRTAVSAERELREWRREIRDYLRLIEARRLRAGSCEAVVG